MPARMSGLSIRCPSSVAGPVTTARCGSQRMILAPIPTSLSTKNRRLSNIFSKIRTVPNAWVATVRAIDVRSAGNAGHGPVLDLRDVPAEVVLDDQLLARRDADRGAVDLRLDSEPAEGGQDRDQVVRVGVLDRHVARGHGGEADEARHLDVVGPDPPLAAGERRDALDAEHVRLDPLDLRSERDEEAAEILDVWLAGGVADHGLTRRQHGGHDGVLGRHHAGLVQEDALAAETPVCVHLVAVAQVDCRAHPGEGVDVRIESAAADQVAAGRWHGHLAEPGEQRPGEQERGAHAAA